MNSDKYWILVFSVIISNMVFAADLKPGESFQDCDVCPVMVVLPAGSGKVGSEEVEESVPVHDITIQYNLAVGRFPVTVAQFREFLSETPKYLTAEFCWNISAQGEHYGTRGLSWNKPGFPQADNHPAVCVNWHDAVTYLRWLSGKTGRAYRLLSEVEWEYAARAGESDVMLQERGNSEHGNFGAAGETCCSGNQAGEDQWVNTAPVDAFAPNKWGIYDMIGNAYDWVSDCVNGDYVGAPADGSSWQEAVRVESDWSASGSTPDGVCVDRITRGRTWLSPPNEYWFAERGWWRVGFPFAFVGFRVATVVTDND